MLMWDRIYYSENPSYEDLVSEKCQSIYSFWQEQCDGQQMPDCSNLKPSDIAGYLASVIMVDIEGGAMTDYRLMYRGKDLEEITADIHITDSLYHKPDYADMVRHFDWVVENKKPYFIKGVPSKINNLEIHLLALPFRHGSDEVKRLLLVLDQFAMPQALYA